MTLARLSICALLVGSVGSSASAMLTNGSLTGPVGAGIVPPGWSLGPGSPDTCDASGPFNYGLPWVLSPDGGTFVRGGSDGTSTFETLSQTMTGLTIGSSYQVDFFQSNLGFVNQGSGVMTGWTGVWDFGLDGPVFASSAPMLVPASASTLNVWTSGSVSFVATATSHTLSVGSRAVDPAVGAAHMGVDGLRVSEVPGPGVAFVLGAAGLLAGRRRR